MRDLEAARLARQQAERESQLAPHWWQRRAATKDLDPCAERETDAQHWYEQSVTPELARLEDRIDACRLTLEQVEARSAQYRLAECVVAELSSS